MKTINISASTGATILGLNDWSTPVEAWLKIMEDRKPGFCNANNFELPEIKSSPEMDFGHQFESAIIKKAEMLEGTKIVDREKLFSVAEDIITCHVDGVYFGNMFLHEGKTTSIWYYADHFGEPGSDKVPIQYQIQCQHQLMCTGFKTVILSVLVFPKRPSEMVESGVVLEEIDCYKWVETLHEMGFFHQFVIERNDELIDKMKSTYLEWWFDHIEKETPPEFKRYDDIRKLIRQPSGTILASENLERISAEYKAINKEKAEIEKRKDDLKTRLLSEMQSMIAVNDSESVDKWVLRNGKGQKLHSYDGKQFR